MAIRLFVKNDCCLLNIIYFSIRFPMYSFLSHSKLMKLQNRSHFLDLGETSNFEFSYKQIMVYKISNNTSSNIESFTNPI
jgi:hypothetical protein